MLSLLGPLRQLSSRVAGGKRGARKQLRHGPALRVHAHDALEVPHSFHPQLQGRVLPRRQRRQHSGQTGSGQMRWGGASHPQSRMLGTLRVLVVFGGGGRGGGDAYLIADNERSRMLLDSGASPHVINALLYRLAEGVCLVLPGDDNQDLPGILRVRRPTSETHCRPGVSWQACVCRCAWRYGRVGG